MSSNRLQDLVDSASLLIRQINDIISFEDVRRWDDSANEIASQIRSEIDSLNQHLASLPDEPVAEQKTGFFARFTKSKPTPSERDNIVEVVGKLDMVAQTLEEWIDRTPDTVEEAKSLIAEYKLVKKELALEKREATTALRDAREASRNNMAKMTGLRGGIGRFGRDMERLRKESQLSKHQSARDQVEAQIIAVEKRILWLEKISRS